MPELHTDDFGRVFTQIAVFAEELNILCWRQVMESPGIVQLQSPLLELRKRIAWASRSPRSFRGNSELFQLLVDADLDPHIELDLADKMCEIMLAPAQVAVNNDGEMTLTGIPHLPMVQMPAHLNEHVWLDATEDFSSPSRSDSRYGSRLPKNVRASQWVEALDPIAAIEMFLVRYLEVSPHKTYFFVQTWLQATFSISYNKDFRYSLFKICDHLNKIFFGTNELSRFDRSSRSSLAASRLVCKEVFSLLPENEELTRKRQTIGIFLALRQRGFLNCRMVSIEQSALGEEARRGKSRRAIHCTQALQPIGYTPFLARLFGSSFGISGLSDILQGGLLAITEHRGQSLVLRGRAGSGKTVLALSIAADVAERGGLSIYMSTEESYTALIDRLIAFRLYDSRKYQVLVGDERILLQALETSTGGKLILYSHSNDLPVQDVIRKAGGLRWRGLRSIVVDSVNALAGGSVGRDSLMTVIESIESSGLLGVLVAEDVGEASINYLADTVIQLGTDETRQHRWLEIGKCRAQDYLPGRHIFRIGDMVGLKCYPNLAGVRHSLRQRRQQPLSETRIIAAISESLTDLWLPEKSSVLIWGPPGTGKTTVALDLLTAGSRQKKIHRKDDPMAPRRPRHILVVSFSTPQGRFLQMVRTRTKLFSQWQRVNCAQLKWIPPGNEVSPEEVISDLQIYIRESKQRGLPLERVTFHDVEVAGYHSSPVNSSEAYFWPTLFELLRTEGVTSIFVNNSESAGSPLTQLIEAEADFSIMVSETDAIEANITLRKRLKSPATLQQAP